MFPLQDKVGDQGDGLVLISHSLPWTKLEVREMA